MRVISNDLTIRLNQIRGEAETYNDLAAILAARREALGLSQMELGLIAGLQDGNVAKLEIGHRGDTAQRTRKRAGRTAVPMSLYVWLKALGVKLLVVQDNEADGWIWERCR
jgi:transcriptional regulator with XRE-family HTH domain